MGEKFYVLRRTGKSAAGMEVAIDVDVRAVASAPVEQVERLFATDMYEQIVRDEGDESQVTWGDPALVLVERA